MQWSGSRLEACAYPASPWFFLLNQQLPQQSLPPFGIALPPSKQEQLYSPMHPHAQPSVPELRSRAEPAERKPPKPLAVGVNEAAKILGISPWTIRCYVTQGALRGPRGKACVGPDGGFGESDGGRRQAKRMCEKASACVTEE